MEVCTIWVGWGGVKGSQEQAKLDQTTEPKKKDRLWQFGGAPWGVLWQRGGVQRLGKGAGSHQRVIRTT